MKLKEVLEYLQDAYDKLGDIPVTVDFVNSKREGNTVKDITYSKDKVTIYNWI